MKKRVLITGGSGFVGYHLIEAAISSGLEVSVAVRSSSSVAHLSIFDIKFVYPDFSSTESLIPLLEQGRYNYIVHASGITKAKSAEEYNKINAEYSNNLALAAVKADIPLEKFVFVSSLAAIGPLENLDGIIQDNTPARPVTLYGSSKMLAEQYLARITNLPLVIIRPTAVYGPREKDIFILLKSIYKGIEPHIGKFSQKLSFIYVKDLANVIVDSLSSAVTNAAYNVSDGYQYDRYALAEGVKKAMHKKTFKFHIPVFFVSFLATVMEKIYSNRDASPTLNKEKMNELTALNWICSIEHARKDLSFKPAYNLNQGLEETVRWYKQNNWL